MKLYFRQTNKKMWDSHQHKVWARKKNMAELLFRWNKKDTNKIITKLL